MHCLALTFIYIASASIPVHHHFGQNDTAPLASKAQFTFQECIIDFAWEFDIPNNLVKMTLAYDWPGYFSFGLGSSMAKADMWLFEVVDHHSIVAKDMSSSSYAAPPLDTEQGGTEDLELLGYHYDGVSKTLVKFQRKIETGDQYDFPLHPQKDAVFLFAYGPKRTDMVMTYHKDKRGVFKFDFLPGSQQIYPPVLINWFDLHIWFNLVFWGLLADLAIMLSRYIKDWRYRMDFHGWFMALGFIFSNVANLALCQQDTPSMSYLEKYSVKPPMIKLHIIIWFISLALVSFQMIQGFLLRQRILYSTSDKIQEQSAVHFYLGVSLYLLMKLNIAIGLYLYGKELPMFISLCAIGFLSRILAELIFRHKIFLFTQSRTQNQIAPKGKLDLGLIQNKSDWCLFNNQVIDLATLAHPGGQFILQAVAGREISRFIYGAYALESHDRMKPHKHSEYAIQMLERASLGYLHSFEFFQQKKPLDQTVGAESSKWWTLKTVKMSSNTVGYFGFVCDDLEFRTETSYLDQGLSYFVLSTENKDVATRPYTMVLSMARPNVEYREKLLQWGRNVVRTGNLTVRPPQRVLVCDELPFLIKKYNSPSGLSTCLHQNTQPGFRCLIQGPFIAPISFPQVGHLVLICGGTGLYPFLDFLDEFLKQTISMAIERATGQALTNELKSQRECRNLRVTLMLAVANEEDLVSLKSYNQVGREIYLELGELQKQLEKPNWKLIIRGNLKNVSVETTHQDFNADFLKQTIPDIHEVQQFLICGPPRMNKQVPETLKSMGIWQNVKLV